MKQAHESPFRARFGRVATRVSKAAGSAWTFALALAVIVVWAITGPVFGFSDTWQLVINTGTTIVTFLMVFLIQNTQNRDAKATQLKLDELIRAISKARNQFIGAESDPEERLERELREVEAARDAPNGRPKRHH
jgi:low affinity Fe/Cu permease